MSIYVGLFLMALGLGYLIVRVYRTRITDDKKEASSVKAKRRAFKRKQKGNTGPLEAARAFRRPAISTGTVQKPWGW